MKPCDKLIYLTLFLPLFSSEVAECFQVYHPVKSFRFTNIMQQKQLSFRSYGLVNNNNNNNQEETLMEPSNEQSNFGRMKYWDETYAKEEEFSWYCSNFEDLYPFWSELVPVNNNNNNNNNKILLPGIGNDASMVQMYDYGYHNLVAFDYAPEGVAQAKKLFGEERLANGVDISVADARNLSYNDEEFDAVLEKGTLDAIYLSGGDDKKLGSKYLDMAIGEMHRVLKTGGIFFSVSAACTDAIKESFDRNIEKWEVIRDGDFYLTEDGYASNNIDATIFAFKKI